MKTASSEFIAHLLDTVTTIATIWRIIRTDGDIKYFTSHDEDLLIDGNTYLASLVVERSAVDTSDKLDPNNLDISGLIDIESLDQEDLIAGIYDYADIEIALVNWNDVSMGEAGIFYGKLGNINVSSELLYSTEARGISSLLQQNVLEVYQPDCRADLGDDRCKIPIYPDVLQRGQDVVAGEFYRIPTLVNNAVWENIITNADFELDNTGVSLTAITGWTVDTGNWAIRSSNPDPQNGARYLIGSLAATAELTQLIDLAAIGATVANIDSGDFEVSFSGWRLNIAGLDTGQIEIDALDSGFLLLSNLYDSGTEEISPINSWVERSAPNIALPINTRHIRVRLTATLVDGVTSDTAFDNLVLSMVDKIEALNYGETWSGCINNGSFESDSVQNNANPTGWTVVSGLWDIQNVANGALDAFQGDVYLQGGSSSSSEIEQIVDLINLGVDPVRIDLGKISVDFTVRRANAFPLDEGRVVLEAIDATGTVVTTLLDTGFEEIIPEDTWVPRVFSGAIAATVRSIKVRFLQNRISGIVGNAAFDDAVLIVSDNETIRSDQFLYENRVHEVTISGKVDTRTIFHSNLIDTTTVDGTATLTTRNSFTREAYIDSVNSNIDLDLIIDEARDVDGWFEYGSLIFESGRNKGQVVEIRQWIQAGKRLRLYLPPHFPPSAGQPVRIYAGCNKLITTCRDKFDNVVQYRGHPFIPGSDTLTQYPTG